MAAISIVDVAEKENRHELVLSGKEISNDIEKTNLPNKLFSLTSLNFLEISRTGLTKLSEDLGNLKGLTSLILQNNKLKIVPNSLGTLVRLKTLDISNNELETIPESISYLSQLQGLNASCNALTEFPNVEELTQLHYLDLQNNQLTEVPDRICNAELSLLGDIKLNGNKITKLPDELYCLPSLKAFNVSNNLLTELPTDLCNAPKLKHFQYTGNRLSDKRLAKMADSCQTKAVLDYLRKSNPCKKTQGKDSGSKEMSRKERKKNKKIQDKEKELVDSICVLHVADCLTVQTADTVSDVRPYIVCCIVRHIDFRKDDSMYKRFITLQTKLHDSVCQSRQAGTIATHDLGKIKGPLSYEAREPNKVMVVPLFKSKAVCAEELVAKIRQKADDYRKEKKRSTISGIHKYLDLLKDKPLYPCLVDREGTVISFPPITNCDSTKISADTTAMLIEVTSTITLDTCKTIMQTLLDEMLQLGIGSGPAAGMKGGSGSDNEEGAANVGRTLTLEQVQVVNAEGQLKVVYPSRVDLVSDSFKVIRQS